MCFVHYKNLVRILLLLSSKIIKKTTITANDYSPSADIPRPHGAAGQYRVQHWSVIKSVSQN